MKNKKEQIINLLRYDKRLSLSTNKIASTIKSNYYRTLELLNELKKEKKIKQYKELMGISWGLNIADISKVKKEGDGVSHSHVIKSEQYSK